MNDSGITTGMALLSLGLSIYGLVDLNRQRKRELRWKQADKAKEIIDEIFMFESTAQALDVMAGIVISFDNQQVKYADLLNYVKNPTSGQSAIQDSIGEIIDDLNYYFDRIEAYIEVDYLNFADIKPSFEWYINRIMGDRSHFIQYAKVSGYKRCGRFLDRF